MLSLLAAVLLAQAHVHGADAAVPMESLPHALDEDAPRPKGTMTFLSANVRSK